MLRFAQGMPALPAFLSSIHARATAMLSEAAGQSDVRSSKVPSRKCSLQLIQQIAIV